MITLSLFSDPECLQAFDSGAWDYSSVPNSSRCSPTNSSSPPSAEARGLSFVQSFCFVSDNSSARGQHSLLLAWWYNTSSLLSYNTSEAAPTCPDDAYIAGSVNLNTETMISLSTCVSINLNQVLDKRKSTRPLWGLAQCIPSNSSQPVTSQGSPSSSSPAAAAAVLSLCLSLIAWALRCRLAEKVLAQGG